MPRKPKGPRLAWRAARPGKSPARYVIKDDGGFERSTGTSSRPEAEKALADYILSKSAPVSVRDPESMQVGDALAIYAQERAPSTADPARIAYAIDALAPFWGELAVSAIKGATCRRYAAARGVSDGTIRRELGVLRAALRYCEAEGYLTRAPTVTLPQRPPPKERWLTRGEVARLIWAVRTDGRSRHLAAFILIGVYTGTRKSAALALRFQPSVDAGWIDTANGLLYRAGAGKRQTKKRQPSARLPRQFLAHARRWERARTFPVEHAGARVLDIKRAWGSACAKAGVEDATPHSLRHTAITWAMQRGANIWDVAGFFGVSVEELERVYGHHHPDHQKTAVEALESR